jgi:hypothetical protein
MSLKRKTMALCALGAMSILVSVNASATTGGHFVFDTAHPLLKGTEGVTEYSEPKWEFLNVVCPGPYSGTVSGEKEVTTTEQIDLIPEYSKCAIEGNEVTVNMNGCFYRMTIGQLASEENTVHLVCPIGKQIEITIPGCLMKIPPQGPLKGVTYTTVVKNEKHAVVIDFSIGEVTTHFEAPSPCIFKGTKHAMTISGSVVLQAFTTEGKPVDFTATGPKDS